MKQTNITRRKLLKTLQALGVGGALYAYLAPLARGGQTLDVGTASGDADPRFEKFRTLSRIATFRDELDAGAMEKMFRVFMDEPWGPEHIDQCHAKISAALQSDADLRDRHELKDEVWKLSDGEKWFMSHLLTTWYLGIYYHEQRPTQRIMYETALMFDVIREYDIPVPFVEATGFGEWAKPPRKFAE